MWVCLCVGPFAFCYFAQHIRECVCECVNPPRHMAECPNQPFLLALGILSAPGYHGRRMAQRHSWMRWPHVGSTVGKEICAKFIIGLVGLRMALQTTCERELAAHSDMLLVQAIGWNESRVRGPVFSLAWWMQYSARAFQHAQFIGKADDDAYLHIPDLQRLLQVTRNQMGPDANVYMGVHTWYHWYESLFDHARHGWSFPQARRAGGACRATEMQLGVEACPLHNGSCGRCVGPFAFAAGYLIVCSNPLVRALMAKDAFASETARLMDRDPLQMYGKNGKKIEQVMEDVWLGSLLYRFPLPHPVRYISLLGDKRSRLYVDQWDFRLARSAFLFHVLTKQLERYLALHDIVQRPDMHCSRPFEIRCAAFCATRAQYAARIESGEMSQGCSSGVSISDEWCTVSSPVAAEESVACCGMPIKSCTAYFGSNRWPQPFRQKLPFRRFDPLPRSAANESISGISYTL